MLTSADVRWVAQLARLDLAETEVERLGEQLRSILHYVEQLRALDTTGVEPLAHPLDLCDVFRDDEPKPSLSPDEALSNAPERRGDFYGVPAVLE